MLHRSILAAVIAAPLAFAATAQSATLDFSAVQGSQSSPLVLSNATITNFTSSTIIVGPSAAGQADGFCFLGTGCEADGEIVFSVPVSNLSFDVDGANPGDSVTISGFNGATLVGSVVATTDGNLDFSSFGSITRLYFDDASTGAGFGYSTFVFDAGGGNVVPAPAALPLFAVGLLGLVGAASRRR